MPKSITKGELLKILEGIDDSAPIHAIVSIDGVDMSGDFEVTGSHLMCPGFPGCTHVGPAPDDDVFVWLDIQGQFFGAAFDEFREGLEHKAADTEKKYEFLLSALEIRNVDLWEKDALLVFKKELYFQFPDEPGTMDECVEAALKAHEWDKANKRTKDMT